MTESTIDSDGETVSDPESEFAKLVHGMKQLDGTMNIATNTPLLPAIKMASLTSAELTGIYADLGSSEVSRCADILELSQVPIIDFVYATDPNYLCA